MSAFIVIWPKGFEGGIVKNTVMFFLGAALLPGAASLADVVYFTASSGRLLSLDTDTNVRTLIAGPKFEANLSVRDESTGDVIFIDTLNNALLRATAAGEVSVVSDAAHGSGPALNFGYPILAREASGPLLVGSSISGAIVLLRVDPATGNRSQVLNLRDNPGADIPDTGPLGICVTPDGTIYIATNTANLIYKVDEDTASLSTITITGITSSTPFPVQSLNALLAENDQSLFVIHSPNGLHRVNVSTGAATEISTISVGTGPGLAAKRQLSLQSENQMLFSTGNSATGRTVYAADLTTGNRTIISDGGSTLVGTGPAFVDTTKAFGGIAKRDADTAYVTCGSVFSVNVQSGDRTLLAPALVAEPILAGSLAMTVGGTLYGLRNNVSGYNGVLRIDVQTGVATQISGYSPAVGSGPQFQKPRGLILDGEDTAYTTEESTSAIVRVDLVTGERVEVSKAGSSAIGSGPGLGAPVDLVLIDPQTFIVSSQSHTGLLTTVDMTTGNRVVLSSQTVGSGPQFGGMAYPITTHGGMIYAASNSDDAIFAINASGVRSIVTNNTIQTDLPISNITGLAMLDEDTLIYAQGSQIIAVEISNGARSIYSDGSVGSGALFAVSGTMARAPMIPNQWIAN
ncbi:hypothetical protein IT570_09860 [Candidatus Sumerlaeota bacterium]|nr:hypothetical protein [Candidatus Sumerlaeota bacterium]